MEVAVNTMYFNLNPKINAHKQMLDFRIRLPCSHHMSFTSSIKITSRKLNSDFTAVQAASPGLEDAGVSTSPEGITVVSNDCEGREIKMRVNVSGAKTQDIFDNVLSKMVAAAQPIPGFRRVKGGKTPDIPKDVLLHILGPSKVNKQSVKKIINTAVAEYVEKEGLKVTKDLRVEESYEELEATFVPGKQFSFSAAILLVETEERK